MPAAGSACLGPRLTDADLEAARQPCSFGPGTPEKVRVLAARFKLRLPLFRLDDRIDGAAPPRLPEKVALDGDRFRARLWVPRLRRQLHVGCFASAAEAERELRLAAQVPPDRLTAWLRQRAEQRRQARTLAGALRPRCRAAN